MKILAGFLLGLAVPAAALDCRQSLIDNANVLSGREGEIRAAMSLVTAKGGDPKVVTDDPAMTPEQYVDAVRRECPTWQSSSGAVKNNLIVLVVFPKQRKVGYFMGKEFSSALNPSLIRTTYMAPAFRDGDWARGMVQGLKESAVELEAFQTAPLHPATTVVNKQATDLHGLWVFMDWTLFIIILVLVVVLGVYLIRRKERRHAAQQRAVRARNEAADAVNRYPEQTLHAETFARLSQSETYNPENDKLSEDEYEEIERRFNNVRDRILNPTARAKQATPPSQPDTRAYRPPEPAAPSAPPAPVTSNTTVIYNDSPGFIPVPVVVEEPVYESRHESYTTNSYAREDSGFSGGSSDTGDNDSNGFDGGSSDSGGDSGFSGGSDSF